MGQELRRRKNTSTAQVGDNDRERAAESDLHPAPRHTSRQHGYFLRLPKFHVQTSGALQGSYGGFSSFLFRCKT